MVSPGAGAAERSAGRAWGTWGARAVGAVVLSIWAFSFDVWVGKPPKNLATPATANQGGCKIPTAFPDWH